MLSAAPRRPNRLLSLFISTSAREGVCAARVRPERCVAHCRRTTGDAELGGRCRQRPPPTVDDCCNNCENPSARPRPVAFLGKETGPPNTSTSHPKERSKTGDQQGPVGGGALAKAHKRNSLA